MKKVISALVFAGVLILSGCSDYKKVDLESFSSFNLDLKRDMVVSSDGTQTQLYLNSITIDNFVRQVSGGSKEIQPNKKSQVKIESLGEIMIRIKLDGSQISNIELWMTDEQLGQLD